jgi:hypothetical protein
VIGGVQPEFRYCKSDLNTCINPKTSDNHTKVVLPKKVNDVSSRVVYDFELTNIELQKINIVEEEFVMIVKLTPQKN